MEITHFHLFCGAGGGALDGKSHTRWRAVFTGQSLTHIWPGDQIRVLLSHGEEEIWWC